MAIKRDFIPPGHYFHYALLFCFAHRDIFMKVFQKTFLRQTESAQKAWLDLRNEMDTFSYVRQLFHQHTQTATFIYLELLQLNYLQQAHKNIFVMYLLSDFSTFEAAVLEFFFDLNMRPNYKERFALKFRLQFNEIMEQFANGVLAVQFGNEQDMF
jgi:hypothetical protein